MNMPQQKNGLINQEFYTFINEEVLPLHHLHPGKFWDDFIQLIEDLAPVNRQLLLTRQTLQNQIDDWHLRHQGQPFDAAAYQSFLHEIGYIIEQGDDFCIETQHVDDEIATIAGPQLVVPAKNARFALNAANARWGSLYDALYGSDVIPKSNGLKPGNTHNPARAKHVIAYAKDFLDQAFPLTNGSHHDVTSYVVYFQHLMAFFPDGSNSGLKQPGQFVALSGHKSEPETIVLKNNGLHVEIQFDRNGFNGATDIANIDDILLEAAVSTIIDCEDSVAAVDSEDKIEVYRNWLGLMQGNLQARFEKDAKTCVRKMNKDKLFTAPDGEDYWLHGRSLLLVRNVGHLMESDLIQQSNGEFAPEGIVDAVVTSLIGALDLQKQQGIRNSRTGSIYIVKPKMHGPDEVMFSCQLFTRVEAMLGLAPNTIKIGIMDEERRTSVNLKECIRMAKQRLVFINTGFLDRTGDEIHTSMQAGAFLPKGSLKSEPWIKAYENRNVDIGLQCGLQGKAQIGKGMWAMPDEMQQMMEQKINHPLAGATTAWVPSPTAAVLHAMHYHQVNVTDVQNRLKQRNESPLSDLLTIPLLAKDAGLSTHEVEQELENNIQGLLGYVVRWIDAGVGCSKVPDINNIGLMEDRATLRISSQHIANWLHHGICSQQQVLNIMHCMAEVVDQQNSGVAGYQPMAEDLDNNLAFKAAKALIFEGLQQPSGYTEPLLHKYRCLAKQVKVN
ncbi:malate synthase G [Neptunicella sp.]|uniref:malate synthase G n=1 Tax=Neptunicella sp. TaxID=2125986 RepID=UPI003F694456